MGKTKRLKKLMEVEAELLYERLNKLTAEVAEMKRQAAKNLHPSTMTPAATNWCALVDAENAKAAAEAKAREAVPKQRRKRVTFRRVRADLFPLEFSVSRYQASELSRLGVTYQIRPLQNPTHRHEFLLQFTPFITYAVGDITTRVNHILGDSGSVYAEVQILA